MRSAPFAIFNRNDLLGLALNLGVKVPEIYGTIERDDESGQYYTTRAQRTGCDICGFGIHLEKRPHRFDRLREDNPQAWRYWMYDCAVDPVTGEKYGWGRVLDYIGVDWEDEYVDLDAAQERFLGGAGMKEVIFCEDCKYRGWLYGIEIAFCTRDGGYVDKDDFCSRGKKCEGKEKETKK